MYARTQILLRYNLSESLKQHCDLPQVIIVISPINHEKKIWNIIQTLPYLQNSYVPKIRQKSNFSEVKIEYTHGQLYVYVQGNTYVEGSTVKIKIPIPKQDWPQNECPKASVIAQHYSSATFISLRFHSHKLKFDARLKNVIFLFTFTKLPLV